jgi:hypothetical protein
MALRFDDLDPINAWRVEEWREEMMHRVEQVEQTVDEFLRLNRYSIQQNDGSAVELEVELFRTEDEAARFDRVSDGAKRHLAGALKGRYASAGWDAVQVNWDARRINLVKKHPPLA